MCEIAILDTDAPTRNLTSAAREIYEAMRDSLGILAAFRNGDEFTYEIYKAVEPDWESVETFFDARKDDAWRFFIHGRLATAGAVSVQNAHPIRIDCDACSIEHIMHNGVVYLYDKDEDTHNYRTPVDTEQIAHSFGDIPDTPEEAAEQNEFRQQSAFVLFGRSKILVYGSHGYSLTDEMLMARRHRQYAPNAETYYSHILITL